MLKQYLSIKEQYPDAILLYRMGDFYEMFFEDAEVASRVLEITLTSRNKKDETPVPMCGVPHRAAQGYIGRLIDNGYKVAICDQVEDPAEAKGLVKREVVRVITPGMIVDEEFLDERSNNYILAVAQKDGRTGLCCLDISTGTFRVAESDDPSAVIDETLRISPREVLLPESAKQDGFFARLMRELSERAVTFVDDKVFAFKAGYDRLVEQFKTLNLEGFGIEHLQAGVTAAGAVLFYVRETQKQSVSHLTRLESYSLDNYLVVDEVSCRNLELLQNIRTGSRRGTLLGGIDRTVTAMGARLLKNWLRYPPLDIAEICARHDAVEEAKAKQHGRQQLRECLNSASDLERIGSKIAMGQANARHLLALKQSLQILPAIWRILPQFEAPLFQLDESLDHLNDLAALLERAIREDAPLTVQEGGMIKAGFHDELDELVQISRDGKGWLARLETRERENTGINTLRVSYNKVFGYYIEVPKSRADAVPANFVRKQTLVNAERYITEELKSFETKVLGAEDRRAVLEYEIFSDLRQEAARHHESIQRVARFLARLDCVCNLAEIAAQNNYCRPVMNQEGRIEIEDGRHPVIEKMITGERFVPNSLRLDNHEEQVLIITGPNMAGKSTVLRQVALMVVLAHMGSFVPARRASICLTDRIFTRVGALDNLSHGQSTFMVEMQETANILNNASENSLVILDEIGRGTSTFDGLSIAWAVAEYLHDLNEKGVKTLFATHYHELTELAKTKTRVKNYNIAVKEWNDEIIFLRKLVEGGTNRSYGIQVARLAGIPALVVDRAKKILYKIENDEHVVSGPGACAAEKGRQKAGAVQLTLFRRPDRSIIEDLARLDISTMTPLEALNYLDSLREKANAAR
jgi:DNA mismatch repair protein MutS